MIAQYINTIDIQYVYVLQLHSNHRVEYFHSM